MSKRIDRSNISLYPYVPKLVFKDEAEAWAIEALSKRSPLIPLVQEINPGQHELWEVYGNKWAIIGWWLVYFRTRAANIKKFPYNLQEFKDSRSYAWVLNKRLDLFAGVFELVNMEEHYSTPLEGWQFHIEQLQQAEKQGTLLGLTYPQRETYIEAKQELEQLSEANVPFIESAVNLHHYRLLNAATCLIRRPISIERERFKRDYWEPYLSALGDWIEDLGGKKYVGIRVAERHLQQRKRGRPPKASKK